MGVSVYWCLSVLCVGVGMGVGVGVCLRSHQSTSKSPHHVSELNKLDTLLHKICIKVLRLDMWTSMISLSKIAASNVAWSPIQPKKQDNRIGSGVGGWRWQRRGGWTKLEIGGVGKVRRVFIKRGGQDPSTNYEVLMVFKLPTKATCQRKVSFLSSDPKTSRTIRMQDSLTTISHKRVEVWSCICVCGYASIEATNLPSLFKWM